MPRYFFHVRDGQDLPDTEGLELAGDSEAKIEAVRASGTMLADLHGQFWDHGEWTMLVVDEVGREVCKLLFQGMTPQ